MNPLTFFPPPSRSLSRVDSRPSPGNGSAASSVRSGKRALQPLSTSVSTTKVHSNGQASGTSSEQASGATTPERTETNGSAQNPKRPVTSPMSSSDILSPRLMATESFSSGYASDPDVKHGRQSGLASPRKLERGTSSKRTQTQNSAAQSTGGRLGHRLPQGMYFDLVRPGEVGHAHKLERASYDIDDAATLDTLRYRQKEAPHLFLGAFLPVAPPKVSGPLSMSGPPPRKLIAYACGTAASALTARSIKVHSDDEHSWLVCAHSICVATEFRRKGLALKLIEEYIRRLRRAEEGRGDRNQPKKGYETVAVLSHEDTIPLFEKAGFKKLGVSHVNSGSGGWFELRRDIVPKDNDDDAGEGAASSDKSDVRSPPAGSTIDSAEMPLADAGKEVSTTPTQELERQLRDHAAQLSIDETKATSAPALITDLPGEGSGLSMSPSAMSPTIASPLTEDIKPLGNSVPAAPLNTQSTSAIHGQATPFSTAQIMEALRKQTGSASNRGGNCQAPRNPGVAYSTIMGQTLASKTSMEDAFYALEARLVNREDQSNLADLYCPREECSCLLLKAGNADWEIAELGPLSQTNLSLPDSPSPPSAPVPPPPATVDRVRSALGSQRSSAGSTAARAFWIVHSPMIFENVGFSRDSEWRLPPLPSNSISSNGSDGTADSGNAGERKKPNKRGSLFRGASEWIQSQNKDRKKEKRGAGDRDTPTHPSLSPPSFQNTASSSGGSITSIATSADAQAVPANVQVKYLLCADCDCGPLGYTVLPRSLEGGNFATEVGKQAQGEAPSQEPEMQLYFVASDRVRYRFPK